MVTRGDEANSGINSVTVIREEMKRNRERERGGTGREEEQRERERGMGRKSKCGIIIEKLCVHNFT